MGHNGNSYYIGIDLNDSYAMVSFFQQNMKEPETVALLRAARSFRFLLYLHAVRALANGIMEMRQEDSLKAVRWCVLTSCLREH